MKEYETKRAIAMLDSEIESANKVISRDIEVINGFKGHVKGLKLKRKILIDSLKPMPENKEMPEDVGDEYDDNLHCSGMNFINPSKI